MKRTRLRLKRFAETSVTGRFPSNQKELVGFDLEEVRRLQPGDHPASSSFDPLRSALYKRFFLRVKRAERTLRILFALDWTPSMEASLGDETRRLAMLAIVSELAEGFSEGANEVGFLLWSSKVDSYLPPLSGSVRARKRLADLSILPAAVPPTRPAKLFEYLRTMGRKPQITFVFSDWYDTGDFKEELRRCLISGLDIVPVVVADAREGRLPWFFGDILLYSSESGERCFVSGSANGNEIEGVFRSLNLPFIAVSASASREDWDEAFEEFFAARERERR
ncbi:MAG: hypothetical protein HYW90_00985 [Candidatus Sungbacteria bacterium]|nr:hypothetical protein [Candidatus Sungbacteria bacterium]